MAFDWKGFLESEGIHFVESGKNVKRGNIAIKCPFCGDLDPSQHMGLNLTNGRWGCLRDGGHRGNNPTRLIKALKGCDWTTALELSKDDLHVGSQSIQDLAKQAYNLGRPSKQSDLRPVEMPGGFRPIRKDGLSAEAYEYLRHGRKFGADTADIIRRYDLRFTRGGYWRNRVIVPLVRGNVLKGWTGRAIHKATELRYLSHPEGDELKSLIWNYDYAARGGRTLAIVEGPFDGIPVDYYSFPTGRAVALLTATYTPAKLAAIMALAQRYERVVILLDAAAVTQAYALAAHLAIVKPKIIQIQGYKDPGEMPPSAIRRLGL